MKWRAMSDREAVKMRRNAAGVVIAASCLLLVLGCGQARVVGKGSVRPAVKYVSGGQVTVASGSLPGNATFSIDAVMYRFEGVKYSKLEYRMITNQSGRVVASPGGGNVDIGGREEWPLDLEVLLGCVSSAKYIVAYGILRNRKDRVAAVGEGVNIKFNKVELPTLFQSEGVVVYAVLDQKVSRIVTVDAEGNAIWSLPVGRVAEGETVINELCS